MNPYRSSFFASLVALATLAPTCTPPPSVVGAPVVGITSPRWTDWRALPAPVNVAGWQDGTYAVAVNGTVRVDFSYNDFDAAWYDAAKTAGTPERAWVEHCVDANPWNESALTPAARAQCVATLPLPLCSERWFDACSPHCEGDPSCPARVMGPQRLNPTSGKWSTYTTSIQGQGWAVPALASNVNASGVHRYSFSPYVHDGALSWAVLTGTPADLYFTSYDAATGWAPPWPGPVGLNTNGCAEDQGVLTVLSTAPWIWRLYFASDRDPAKTSWETPADCTDMFHVWRADVRGDGTLVNGSIQRVAIPGGQGDATPWDSQPWVDPAGAELWYSAKYPDCADSAGNDAASCMYRAERVDGAWTNRTLEIRPTPLSQAAEGDVVGVGECNPVTVPQTSERRLICTACIHHAAAPRCDMRIVTAVEAPLTVASR